MEALSECLHASGLLKIGLEAGGIGIREVVAPNSQAVHGLFGPGHGDIKQVIHGILRQTDDSDRRNAIRVPTAEIWWDKEDGNATETERGPSPLSLSCIARLTDLQDGLLQRTVDLQRTGVGLEVTLGSDQVNQLGGQIHVGLLQRR